VAGQPRALRSMRPRSCYRGERPVAGRDKRELRNVAASDALGAQRVRRTRSTDVVPKADGNVAASTAYVAGADVSDARRDRVNSVCDEKPARALRSGDPRLAHHSSQSDRFDVVSAGYERCGIRADRRGGCNFGGGPVDRCGGAGLRWRCGRMSLFRCDRCGSRKLFGGQPGGWILVVRGDGCRPCNRRCDGRRADRRRPGGSHRQLRDR
jgi:hypothetical protein